MKTFYCANRDGSTDILLYLSSEEFSLDFSAIKNKLFEHTSHIKNVAFVRKVRIIIAGTIVVSIPFSFFARVGANERYAMSYVYYGSGEAQIESVSDSMDTLSVVSPSYFNLTYDGSLSLENISKSFIETMHKGGIRVVPFLSNHWDRQKGIHALHNRENLAKEIAKAVDTYNLDGVNVDIENVTEQERDAYTQFLQLLRKMLPADKEVSVAVAANPWGSKKGWQGSYDYESLAKVCDHLFVMAYDEHYQGGEAGPVASLSFVEKSIQYALKCAPAEKIVLGIPFYGRIWGGELYGYGISMQRIEDIKNKYKTDIYYDSESMTPQMRFFIRNGETAPIIGGKKLTAGEYTIHYENADSIKAKLSLVSKYGLKGAGNWSAGQESADVWEYYELWLNGRYFSDIHDSFAKDAVLRVTEDGMMQGQGEGVFRPDARLTRAEAAVICTRLFKLSKGTKKFVDVPEGYWAQKEIAMVENAKIMVGYPDGTFRPEEPVSRAEMSVLLSRMIESSYKGENYYTDVSEEYWAKEEIIALSQMGILSGYPDKTFRPDNKINRGETAVILERIKEYL